jgi:crossover junction endodeoxyribonuclease RusA
VRVYGRPVPQGSKRVVNGRLLDVNAVELRSWRSDIAHGWADQVGLPAFSGPVSVTLTFFFPRPLGHWGKKGLLPSAPRVPQVRPDLDKLVRAVLDALTGAAFHDDAQVWEIVARKRYADSDPPGLVLNVQQFVPSEPPATLAAERSE